MKNSQKGFIVPLIILILAIVIVGAGVYLYSQNKGVEVNEEVSMNSTSTEVNSWKTYENKQFNYEVKYPTEWSLDASRANPTGDTYVSVASINKDDHRFGINIPSAYSPSICRFPGDAQMGGGASYVEIVNYVEVKSPYGTYRRPTEPKLIAPENKEAAFNVCVKERDSNIFATSNIYYLVPPNYSSEFVSIMDEILKTFSGENI